MNIITRTFCLTTPSYDEECDVKIDMRKNGYYRMIFEFDTGHWALHWDRDPTTLLEELERAFSEFYHWKEPIRFNVTWEV